jgi:SAM-dependent methyltransferase
MNLASQLHALYAEQATLAHDPYVDARNSAIIRRDISILRRVRRYLPEHGRILDWGCHHAQSSCIIRMLCGNSVALHACDVQPDENPSAFFQFAQLEYRRLSHPYRLPYDDCFFDAVVGTATFEHVPNDARSLDELYRIVKPDGVLILTTLPNRWSYTEFLQRRLHHVHHLRIYSLTEIRGMLLHNGFISVASGYHQVFPSMCGLGARLGKPSMLNRIADLLAPLNDTIEKVWPFRCFASNLFVVGRKRTAIDNMDFDLR